MEIFNKNCLYLLLFLTVTFLMICCKNNTTRNVAGNSPIDFSEIISKDLIGLKGEDINNMIGTPDTIRKNNNRDVWSYGPSLEDMVNKADGEIVGLTIYFDDDGKVISVRPKNKTSVENP